MADIKSVFDRQEYKQYKRPWHSRLKAMKRRKSYYTGSVYQDALARMGWLRPTVSRNIKPLYLPLSRAVNVDVGRVPSGWRFPTEPATNTIIGRTDPSPQTQAWIAARDKLFSWSKWGAKGSLYVFYGAQYGLSGLKIIDNRDAGIVRLLPVNPEHFMLVGRGQYDPTPALAFWIESRIDAEGRSFEYAEVITRDAVRTFRNGAPAAFGDRPPEYPNALDFVPIVEVPHIENGDALSESTFERAIPLLDEANRQASHLADVIAKHAEPQWVAFGIEESADLVKSGDNIWFAPEGSDIKPLVPDVDLDGMLEFVRDIRDSVKESLPELAFDELKRKDQIATATVQLQLAELVIKLERIRPNYDQGLVDAMRLAGRAAATMDGADDIEALDTEDLRLDDTRPILPLDPITQLDIEAKRRALENDRATEDGE